MVVKPAQLNRGHHSELAARKKGKEASRDGSHEDPIMRMEMFPRFGTPIQGLHDNPNMCRDICLHLESKTHVTLRWPSVLA